MNQELKDNKTDFMVAGLKSISSLAPLVGGFISEIIAFTIPHQRIDRITDFLKKVEERLSKLEIRQEKIDKYFIDLLEDSTVQSSRSMSEERNIYLSNFMTSSIGLNQLQYEVRKKLIYILSELTDMDIEVLRSFMPRGNMTALKQKYQYQPETIGSYKKLSEKEKIEYDSKKVAWKLHVSTLERFGLIYAQYDPTQLADRKTGLPRIIDYHISESGLLLIKSISEINLGEEY